MTRRSWPAWWTYLVGAAIGIPLGVLIGQLVTLGPP